jgi:hypothetical protein
MWIQTFFCLDCSTTATSKTALTLKIGVQTKKMDFLCTAIFFTPRPSQAKFFIFKPVFNNKEQFLNHFYFKNIIFIANDFPLRLFPYFLANFGTIFSLEISNETLFF